MKKINLGILGLAAMLAGVAVPAGATTIGDTTGGTIAGTHSFQTGTACGASTSSVCAFDIVLNGSFTFTPFAVPVTVTDVDLVYTGGNTVTVVEEQSGIYNNVSAKTALFTFSLSSALTVASNGQSLVVPTITGVTGNGSFLADVGIGANYANYLGAPPTTLFVQGTSATANSVTTFTGNSYGFSITTTPEPVSCVLFGSGLIMVGVIRRKKLFARRS